MRGRLLVATVLSPAVGFALVAYAQQPVPSQMTPMKEEIMGQMAMPMTTGSLRVISPNNGARIMTTDIPVGVAVSNFRIAGEAEGQPYVPSEGHTHAMVDGMTMGKLFNAYTTPDFPCRDAALHPASTD